MASAIEQCLDAFKVRFEAAGLTVETHRDESNPVEREEIDVVALSWAGATFERFDSCGTFMWSVQVVADCWGNLRTGVPVLTACSEMISTCAAVVQTANTTDEWGGLFHDCMPLSISELTQGSGESGVMSIIFAVQYQTLKGDFTQIFTA